MKIRGERECKDCETRWSYYETGAVACPECGSLHSVGVGNRQLHTAGSETLGLSGVKSRLDDEPLDTVAREASETAAKFCRQYGFIDAGAVRRLDETFVAATELRFAGVELARSLRVTEPEEAYLLWLLEGAPDGERPPPNAVPDSMEQSRGLAAAATVRDYRRDVRQYLDEHPDDGARRVLGRVEDHRTRIEALDGRVSPDVADALVDATRAIGNYLIESDVTLQPARERLEALDPDGP